QLQDMNKNLSGKYLLGNNIDASDTVNWNNGAGFKPIGTSSGTFITNDAFTGVFDGLGHTIKELNINQKSTPNNYAFIGLFGYAYRSKINNVGLLGGSITYSGNVIDYTGTLVGWLENSEVNNSFSNINVNGVWCAGGLVGISENSSLIKNSYATGNVTGKDYVGGLVSAIESGSTIENSYAIGTVNGNGGKGGLTAVSNSSYIINSYWNKETTGQSTSSGGGTGLTTAQMQDLSTFTTAGWDIDGVGGTGKIWRIYDGQTAPLLRSFLTSLTITNDDSTTTYNGKNHGGGYQVVPAGTIYDPSLILSLQKNATTSAVTINLNKDLYSIQQGYDLIVQAGSGTGTLKIDPKDITVTASGGSSTYGDNPLNPNFSATGLVNGETESVLTGLSNSFGITNTTNAGSHTLTVAGTLT